MVEVPQSLESMDFKLHKGQRGTQTLDQCSDGRGHSRHRITDGNRPSSPGRPQGRGYGPRRAMDRIEQAPERAQLEGRPMS